MRSPSAPTACAWSRPSSPFAWVATCRRVRRPTNRRKCSLPSRRSIWRSRSRTRAMPISSRPAGRSSIADNACAHRFVIGPQAPASWRQIDLAAHRVVGRVGDRFEVRGHGCQRPGRPAHRAHLARQRAVLARRHARRRPDRDHRHLRHADGHSTRRRGRGRFRGAGSGGLPLHAGLMASVSIPAIDSWHLASICEGGPGRPSRDQRSAPSVGWNRDHRT